MIKVLEFWVPGHPKTKGSLRVLNSGRLSGRAVLQDTPASKRWRALVAYAAGQAMRGATQAWPLEGPVGLDLTYALPVSSIDELCRQGSGDVDKLDRNMLDALQDAGLYANDSQVVLCQSSKGGPCRRGTGVEVAVHALDGMRLARL